MSNIGRNKITHRGSKPNVRVTNIDEFIGTTAGTVAAGDDSRIVNAVQRNATETISATHTYTAAPIVPAATLGGHPVNRDTGDARYPFWNEYIVTTEVTAASTTYADGIVVPLLPDTLYEIEILGVAQGSASSGVKVQVLRDTTIAWASGGTPVWAMSARDGIASSAPNEIWARNGVLPDATIIERTNTLSNAAGVYLRAYVLTNSNDNTLRVRFAQNTSHADLVTLRRGSFIKTRIVPPSKNLWTAP